jgi:SAM-dependent methyltransferase
VNYDSLADLYDRQYEGYRDDLHHYAALAEKLGAGQVLELGSGTGRVSAFLARRGFAVTGLEPSARMLARARERLAGGGLRVDFVEGDMRSFALGKRWPLVIAPFNALMHLYTIEDQDRALARVMEHLEPGGTFAFDLYLPFFGAEGVLRHEGETFAEPGGGSTDVFLLQRIDPLAQSVSTTYYVDTVASNGALSRKVIELTQRYFTRFEVERWLAGVGLRVRWSGGFEGQRLGAESKVMVGTARRA